MTTSLEDVLERTLQCLKSEQGQSIKIQKGSQGSVTGPLMLNGKKVALKVYDYVDSPYVSKVIEDFQRECENLKTLSHPSIVRIIDFDHSPSSHAAYLRMEWASTELSDKGGAIDLNDIICSRDGLRGQPVKSHLPESFIWHTLFHLSAALVLCHYGIEVHRKQSIENTDANRVLSRLMEDPTPDLVDLSRKHPTITWNTEQISFSVRKQHEPIVHRDIKPRNVLLSDPPSEGHDKHWRPQITLDQNTLLSVYPIVLLGDFGLSAPVSVAQTRGIGSYGFRAPEVPIAPHRPGEAEFRWTGSCDIYSMGATLWSLMTLRPPPEDTTNIDWELPSVYSWELRNLISQCHAYDPASRPTAVDLLDACIHRAYWNETYVSPYGILIRPDFQCTIQRSWNEVLRQLRMGRETVNTVKHTESVVSDNFAALMKKPSGNSLSIFIAGAYQHHIFGRKLPPRTRKRPRLPKKPKVVIQQMGSDDTPPHVSNDGMHVEKDEETPKGILLEHPVSKAEYTASIQKE
ncbi:kinase-like domain-containing protein [Lophiotrema nucula]|uniref:non-specific serine/threonine protein kinase n=1 Tax=Lophiotrema nucula TaxID=690887 RepID=A0A6A5ZXU6_9PLEO|nr:kinase-like domain-containing protein [Lophiotrema nucula]